MFSLNIIPVFLLVVLCQSAIIHSDSNYKASSHFNLKKEIPADTFSENHEKVPVNRQIRSPFIKLPSPRDVISRLASHLGFHPKPPHFYNNHHDCHPPFSAPGHHQPLGKPGGYEFHMHEYGQNNYFNQNYGPPNFYHPHRQHHGDFDKKDEHKEQGFHNNFPEEDKRKTVVDHSNGISPPIVSNPGGNSNFQMNNLGAEINHTKGSSESNKPLVSNVNLGSVHQNRTTSNELSGSEADGEDPISDFQLISENKNKVTSVPKRNENDSAQKEETNKNENDSTQTKETIKNENNSTEKEETNRNGNNSSEKKNQMKI
ncbi:hypothetical protein HHI36_011239 [Cryptolaemus montrouzieri]|uniref:Uncharacterized protein n=1 Tax=Cryptolaemus montrouzieri TaxID=559131 RepID=A0ABD2ML37_9CUCU